VGEGSTHTWLGLSRRGGGEGGGGGVVSNVNGFLRAYVVLGGGLPNRIGSDPPPLNPCMGQRLSYVSWTDLTIMVSLPSHTAQ
jgi:hypothetical protein